MSRPFADIDEAVEHALLFVHKGKAHGDEIDFCCVVHEEKRASASWNRGKHAWKCLGCGEGGSTNDLARLLAIDVQSPRQRMEQTQVVATYDYVDEDGNLRYQKVRYLPKDFRIRQPNGNGWLPSRKGQPHLLYRLPGVINSTGRVYIVEGEKDADTLARLGLTATTSADGATLPTSRNRTPAIKWNDSLNHWLEGRDVVVVPDLDEAGVYTATVLAGKLSTVASSVRYLQLPGDVTPAHGYDVSDWVGDGGTAEELEALADAAPLIEPPAEPTTSSTNLLIFPCNDAGNAELFAELHGDSVRYLWDADRWLVWRGHYWHGRVDGEIFTKTIQAARARAHAAVDAASGSLRDANAKWAHSSESAGKIDACIKLARSVSPISDPGTGWDENPALIGGETAVANLIRGEYQDGKQSDRITLSTGIAFDPAATCPRWEQFLVEVFGDDPALLAFIQRAVGYSITGSSKEQVWFLLYGAGSNGKSTFVDTIYRLLGDYAGDTPAATITSNTGFTTGGAATPELAALRGKRFITCSETEEMAKLSASRLKMLVGDNPITARALHKMPVTFPVSFKLWLTTNHLPKIDDDSEGFWRRVRLIPFLRTFSGAARDNDLENKLRSELPGIFNWALAGAKSWYAHGLGTPPSVMLATNQYRQAADPIQEWMSDRVLIHDAFKTSAKDLFDDYLSWGKRNGMGEKDLLSATSFGRRLGVHHEKRKIVGQNFYIGLRLRTPDDDDDAQPNTQNQGANHPQKGDF